MKRYQLSLAEGTHALAWSGRGWNGTLHEGDRSYPVEASRINGELSLKVGDRMLRVEALTDGRFRVNGRELKLELRSDLEQRFQAFGLGADEQESGRVVVPMPGKIISILVKTGEAVEKGQGLLLVEAMKMENEIKAPCAGVVETLAVKSGDELEKGALLLEIIPNS